MSISVSLLITNYNRSPYLAAAIESILSQTYPHFDLLIWDDGSTDNSLAIAQHYAQLDNRIRVVAAPHQGIAPTLKAAIAQTTAPYLGWVDSDDRLAPTALAATIAILEAHPAIGLVYTDYQVIDEQDTVLSMGSRCQIPYSKERLLVDFMTFHFRLMRRSIYEQVGGIDPSFQWAEDYDLCLKLSEVTQIHHLPKPLYFYRRHAGNITNNQFEAIRWATIAIEQAIVRRKLDQHYRLDVDLVAHFKLLPKSAVSSSRPTAPLVSVIIPTHNRLTHLDRALQSVLAQTYTQSEIIVVDDGSTDGTTAWLQTHYPQIRLITLPSNQGAAAARNRGVQHAQGQFLAFLDSDDQWHPHYLQRQLDTIAQHPAAVLVYSNYLCSFAADDPGTPVSLQPSHADPIAAMLQACFIHTLSQVVLPTARFKQVGGFNAQLRSCHDWDFYLRLFKLGAPLHCPDFLVRKHWLPNSLVTQAKGQTWLENGLRVLELFHQRPENDRYASQHSIAVQNLRDNIARTHRWLAESLEQTTTGNLPLISIILTCHNAQDSITDCLHCCLAQTEAQIEIIIVDRGSTDATIALIQQCAAATPHRLRLLQVGDASQNAARNLGFEQAQGDYIQWLEVSDGFASALRNRLTPDKIARQVQALEQQRSADIAVGDWEWCGVNQQQQVVAQFTFPAPAADEMLLYGLLDAGCPAASLLLRRSAADQLHQIQAWNPQTPICMDREYLTLAALLECKFLYVPQAIVRYYRWSPTQLTQQTSHQARVQSRKTMFQRFQAAALARPPQSLQPIHWSLLQQNWDLWQPAFVLKQDAENFWLSHPQRPDTMAMVEDRALPIDRQTANVVRALLLSPGAGALEDKARQVVQQMWSRILVRVSRSSQPEQINNFALLTLELSKLLGMVAGGLEPAADDDLWQIDLEGAMLLRNADANVQTKLSPWLLDIPLFSPLFGEQRLMVHGILEQLRQQGWLERVTPFIESDSGAEPGYAELSATKR